MARHFRDRRSNLLCQVKYVDSAGATLDTTNLLYSNGMLAAVVEPGNEVTQFGYTGGLMTTIKSPLAVDWQNADAANRSTASISALVSTSITYRWVQPTAGSTNIRPANAAATPNASGVYPAGSVPLVAAVQGPSPDGTTTGLRAKDSYTYLDGDTSSVGGATTWVANRTQTTTAGVPAGGSTITGDVTYDPSGRTTRATSATGQSTSVVSDVNDLPLVTTDPAGRVTTRIYDWAQRLTDVYGPAPSSAPGTAGSCFAASRFPVAAPPASCGVIPHTHTGYDTTPTGSRVPGLEATGYTTANLTMPPTPAPIPAPVRTTLTSLTPASEASLGAPVRSSRYSGEITLAPGAYTFSAQVGDKVNDGVRVYLDDQVVIDRWKTLRQAVLGDNPTGYWRLGDGAGTVAAPETGTAGVAANVGFGAPANPTGVDPTTTASFNGTSSRVTVASGLISATTHPTIELWFKTAAPGVLFGYQDAGVASNPGMYVPALYVGADGALR
ncbi:MAG: hypothetical protein ACOH17_15235 [Cellulomonas sp.]